LYRTLLQDWLPAICEAQDKEIKADGLNFTGLQYDYLGDYATALSFYEQSLAISQEIGDKSGEGTTLNNMATTAYARGDYDTALTYLHQSLAISQEIGDVAGLCATLFNMGHIHWQNEAQAEAVRAWVTVYQLASQINLAQVLQALEGLAGQLGLPGGLQGWVALAQQREEGS
jgi:tetratricopeptide (TPR) repeat protein